MIEIPIYLFVALLLCWAAVVTFLALYVVGSILDRITKQYGETHPWASSITKLSEEETE
jgi:hypothetical protein